MVIRSYVTGVRIPNSQGQLISLGGHVEAVIGYRSFMSTLLNPTGPGCVGIIRPDSAQRETTVGEH